MSHFKQLTNVYYADGKTYAAGCWRQGVARQNPHHYMLGHGKLFAAAHDNIVPRNMDHLIFHQCPPRNPENWEWARRVWSIIESEGIAKGLWKPGRPNIITLSHQRRHAAELPARTDLVVCAKRLTIEREGETLYLGVNHPDMVRHWSGAVEKLLHESLATVSTAAPAFRDLTRAACEGCPDSLRIGIFQRSEGRSGRRRIHNLDEVQAVAASFTRLPVVFFSITTKTAFEEQLRVFRWLDVIITPHGSQLANMLFAPRTVYVELQAARTDTCFARNGRRLAAGYILSVGHLPVQDRLSRHGMCKLSVERSLIRGCLRREPLNCRRLVNTDLFVNVQRLRADLAAAVATRCKASGCVANLPDAVPAPALRSVDLCPNASSCCPG